MCRKAQGAAFGTYYNMPTESFNWTGNREHIRDFRSSPGIERSFCGICGSGLPRLDAERNVAVTPLGALDDDPGCGADDNIFVGHRAAWFDITDALPAVEGAPPG